MNTASRATFLRDDLGYVHGEIVFARRSVSEGGAPCVLPNYEQYDMVTHDVAIRNARPIAESLSLDSEGFILTRHKTAHAGGRDLQVMRGKYADEMADHIKEVFDASWVVPFRNNVHLRLAAGEAVPKGGWNTAPAGKRGPGGFAHTDYTPETGPMIAARETVHEGLRIRPYSRLMIIQAWRALSPPPQDIPLAFCDASTVRDSDIAVTEYVSNANEPGSTVTRSYVLRHSAKHRWYYFPEMNPDELILFKGYDSDAHYKTWAPHSAFDDRRTYPHGIARESVEGRFFVYYN